MQVNIKHGYVYTVPGRGKLQKNVETLAEALALQADCTACGCEGTCFGYWTQMNSETGELLMIWITGTGTVEDPFVQNIDTYANGLVAVKALKAARDAAEQ